MAIVGHVPDDSEHRPVALESTATLLALVREGDLAARERLVRRYLPILQRWAKGRLPGWARELSDTDDLVQVTLLKALDKVKGFEPRREGAFLAYLRQILMNEIRNEIRRHKRRPRNGTLPPNVEHPGVSPLEEVVANEALEAYEACLALLPERQREAVILRVEFGLTHREVAEAMEFPTWNAARMYVVRALKHLAEAMHAWRTRRTA